MSARCCGREKRRSHSRIHPMACCCDFRAICDAPVRRSTVDSSYFLHSTPVTPGEASLRLMGSCLNVRNLPRAGLPMAGRLARSMQAIALTYGASDDLTGALDVVTRQVLATSLSAND